MTVTKINPKLYWCVNCDIAMAEYEIGNEKGTLKLIWCGAEQDGQIVLCKKCYKELLKKMNHVLECENNGKTKKRSC